jgi:hypothetical protein
MTVVIGRKNTELNRTTMMTSRRSKKRNVINVVHVQKLCSLISKAGHYEALCQKLLTRQYMIVHLFFAFRIDSVYEMEISLSHVLLVY